MTAIGKMIGVTNDDDDDERCISLDEEKDGLLISQFQQLQLSDKKNCYKDDNDDSGTSEMTKNFLSTAGNH